MKAFQLKIMIKKSHPPIWRRVVVPAGITFSQLSMILNKVMGWTGYHQFQFEFCHRQLFVMEDAEEYAAMPGGWNYAEASTTFIREYLEQNDWFSYIYDMGDFWEHRVTVEEVLENYELDYPQVLKYKGDCPPEDCGGIDGYYEFLDAYEDSGDPEHEERLAWAQMQGWGEPYDMKEVNACLQEIFFYRWGKREKRCQEALYQEHFEGKYGLSATKRDKNKEGHVLRYVDRRADELMKRMDTLIREKNRLEALIEEKQQLEAKLRNCSLQKIFADYDEMDIRGIAADKGLMVMASDSKETVVNKLIEYMLKPEEIERYFLCMQDYEIAAFEKTMESTGRADSETTEELMVLYEAAYVGMLNNGDVCIPPEVAEQYRRISDDDFTQKRKVRSYIYACLEAVGILYGIAPLDIVLKLVHTNPQIHLTVSELRSLIGQMPKDICPFVIKKDVVYHNSLVYAGNELLKMQGNKPYYIPTMEEILAIARDGDFAEIPQLAPLKDYLRNKLGASRENAELAAETIQSGMQDGNGLEAAFEDLETFGLRAKNERQLTELTKLFTEVNNNTRMIENRGFTPNEIEQQEAAVRKVMADQPQKKIVSFAEAKKAKIYPNDPCPCGSGKKYKNCCRNK